jgi:hypothetical protein
MYSTLDTQEVNFRILTATVRDAIDHTACDVKTKPLKDVITKLGDFINPTKAPAGKSSAAIIYSAPILVIASFFARLF